MAGGPGAAAIALAAGLVLAACEEAPPVPERKTYELAGTVVDPSTGRGVAGARVTFVSETEDRAAATASTDGAYRLRVTTGSPFGVARADKPGWLPHEQIVLFDGDGHRLDPTLREAVEP